MATGDVVLDSQAELQRRLEFVEELVGRHAFLAKGWASRLSVLLSCCPGLTGP